MSKFFDIVTRWFIYILNTVNCLRVWMIIEAPLFHQRMPLYCWKDTIVISYHDGRAVVTDAAFLCVCVYTCIPVLSPLFLFNIVSKYQNMTHILFTIELWSTAVTFREIFFCHRLSIVQRYTIADFIVGDVLNVRTHSISHKIAHMHVMWTWHMWCSPFVRI